MSRGQEGDLCLASLTCSSQLPEVHTNSCDNISQFSVDSITSQESKEPVFIAAGDIRYGQIPSSLIFIFFFQTPLVSLSLSCIYSPAVSLCLSPLSHYSVLVLKPLYLSQWRCNSGIALAITKRNDILREFQKEASASEGIWASLSKLPLTSMCRPWVQFPAPWENPKPRIKVRSQNCIFHFEGREDTLFKVQILESHPFWINIGIE